MSSRVAIALTFLIVCGGCDATHGGDPDAGVRDAGANDASANDASASDASANDSSANDAGPRPDADLVVHSRCATPPSTRAVSVTYGGACRVDDTGQLWCWGNDEWGQVRPGAPTWVEPHEVAYEGLSDVVSVTDSGLHRCVLHRDGGVSCWGSNRSGECGVPASTTPITRPTRVSGLDAADRIAIAPGQSCARMRADARWLCWGGLGFAATAFGVVGAAPVTPVELPGLRGATALALGSNAAALFDDGRVVAVAVPDSRIAHAYALPGIDDGVDVVAFDAYVCVVRRSGQVWCAGSQTVALDPPPHRVPGIDDAIAFARGGASFYEACVVRADGSLWCWTMARDPAPWPVPAASDVAGAAIGSHVCAVTCGGEVLCNGSGERGENGDDTNRIAPYDVPEIADARAIDGHCALRADGTIGCWDVARWASYDPPCPPLPMPIEPLPGVDRVVRLEDGAALRDDGTFVCVGSPSVIFSGAPAPIVDAACGDEAGLGITADGRLFAWARTPTSGPTTPMAVATTSPVVELTPRALRTGDGTVLDLQCTNFFGLVCTAGSAWPGVSDAEAIWTSPLRYVDLTTVTSTDCVRHAGGEVDCRFGGAAASTLPPLLGIATPASGALVRVPIFDGVAEILAYDTMLCARAASGAVDCWGDPTIGRLGDDDVTVMHTTPVAAGATDLAGGAATCALHADGHVTCWGFSVFSWSSGALCPRPLDRAVRIP